MASVGIDSVDARGSVSARIRAAFVLVDVAVGSVPVGLADAPVAGDLVVTDSVQAGIGRALVHVDLASSAGESAGADA